jgi:NADH-quinone oxidoreductase subunit M
MLLPMFFLIGLWGGKRREYASIKFFLYTLLGSLLILIVMIMLYISVADPLATGEIAGIRGNDMIENVQQSLANIPEKDVVHTFNMIYMTDTGNLIDGSILSLSNQQTFLGLPFRHLAFLLIFIGFAIKIPLVPVHTWLPDAHVEAPTAISVVLAGILLKVGGYGLIRAGYLILPDAAVFYSWLVGLLGVISIIYGAMNALASKDLKRLVAYSSISHMGFVVLGLASGTSEGISGALYQMVSHGIISAALFLLVGVLYDRTHDRLISNYSGLAKKLPAFTVLSVVFFFASMALPGFSGFIAEILVLLGAFSSEAINGFLPRWMMIVAALGMILSAAYYLWTLQRMYFGDYFVRQYAADFSDLTTREYIMLIPLAIMTLSLGLFPAVLLDLINPAVNTLVAFIGEYGMGVVK